MKQAKPLILLFALLFCFAARGLAQYALQVDEVFIPIQNKQVISKRLLLAADTVRFVIAHSGIKKQPETETWEIVLINKEHDGELYKFQFDSNIFEPAVLATIKKIDEGLIVIGHRDPNNRLRTVGAISLIIGP